MAALRSDDGLARVYVLKCSRAGCSAYFNAPLAVRKASEIRELARAEGWRAPTSKAKRKRGDLCPDCRTKETPMATALGAISLTGLLTCKLCDWSELQHNPLDVSERGKLTMHWIEAHVEEFDRIAPKATAIIREGDTAVDLTRHEEEQ